MKDVFIISINIKIFIDNHVVLILSIQHISMLIYKGNIIIFIKNKYTSYPKQNIYKELLDTINLVEMEALIGHH